MSRELRVLFEDNHLLVIVKPAGVLSQGDLSGDLDVLTMVRQLIKRRDNKPGNVYLGLVHRLDRPVGGVMVIAKRSKAAGRLSAQFRARSTTKIYQAVVEGVPNPPEARLVHHLLKDRKTRTTRLAPEGKRAELQYRVLDALPHRALMEITLITGLSHQIRAQLAAVGHPIVGDRKYGSTEPFQRGVVALFAKYIRFNHPIKDMPIEVAADLPEEWPYP